VGEAEGVAAKSGIGQDFSLGDAQENSSVLRARKWRIKSRATGLSIMYGIILSRKRGWSLSAAASLGSVLCIYSTNLGLVMPC
jgi:hypothetical protein